MQGEHHNKGKLYNNSLNLVNQGEDSIRISNGTSKLVDLTYASIKVHLNVAGPQHQFYWTRGAMQKSSARQDDGADLFWADQGVGRHGKVIDPALRSQLSFSGTHILLSKHFQQEHI